MIDEGRAAVQLALGLVFLASALGKLRDPRAFARGVADYEVLPRGLAVAAAWALIPIEALLSAAHLSGLLLRPAALVGLLTLCAFAIGVGVNLRRGRGLPCLCFGARGGELVSARTLARLGLLIAGEALLLAGSGGAARAAPLSLDTLFVALALLCAGHWLLSLPDLVYVVKGCAACALEEQHAHPGGHA